MRIQGAWRLEPGEPPEHGWWCHRPAGVQDGVGDVAAHGDGGPGDGLALADGGREGPGGDRNRHWHAGPAHDTYPGGCDGFRPGGPRGVHLSEHGAWLHDLHALEVPADAPEQILR